MTQETFYEIITIAFFVYLINPKASSYQKRKLFPEWREAPMIAKMAPRKLVLLAHGFSCSLKIARTIAALEGLEDIAT